MNLFSELQAQATAELVKQAEELPIQLSVMNIAHFLGISRTSAYKLTHTEGFPSVQLPGFKRLIIPKKLFIDWYIANIQGLSTEEIPESDTLSFETDNPQS